MPESTVIGDSTRGQTRSENPSKENFQFAWTQEIDKFGDKLLKRLDEFRKSNMYDIRLKVGNEEFKAHKVVLAACGGVFRTCFINHETNMMSESMNVMTINCPPEGIRPILKFAYSGKLEITHRNVFATLLAADVTEMTEVKEICSYIAINKFGWILNDTEVIEENTKKLSKILVANEFISENEIDVNNNDEPPSVYEAFVRQQWNERLGTFAKICHRLQTIIAKKSFLKKDEKITITTPTVPVATPTIPVESESGVENEAIEQPEIENIAKVQTEMKTIKIKTEDSENKRYEDDAPDSIRSAPPKPSAPRAVPRKNTSSTEGNSSNDDSTKDELKEPVKTNESTKPRPRTPPKSPTPNHPAVQEKITFGESRIHPGSPNLPSTKGKKSPEPPKVPPPVHKKSSKKATETKTLKKAPPPPGRGPSPKASRAPGKTPPPRPKPPSIKKHIKTNSDNSGALKSFGEGKNQSKETQRPSEKRDADYDDSLNPFA